MKAFRHEIQSRKPMLSLVQLRILSVRSPFYNETLEPVPQMSLNREIFDETAKGFKGVGEYRVFDETHSEFVHVLRETHHSGKWVGNIQAQKRKETHTCLKDPISSRDSSNSGFPVTTVAIDSDISAESTAFLMTFMMEEALCLKILNFVE